MRKEAKLVLVSVSLILVLSMSVVSAGFFNDFWDFITGRASGGDIVEAGTCTVDSVGEITSNDCGEGYVATPIIPQEGAPYTSCVCQLASLQCTSGTCCNTDTTTSSYGTFKNAGAICNSATTTLKQYVCSGINTIGANVQIRDVTMNYQCTGSSDSCPTTKSPVSFGSYGLYSDCSSSQVCVSTTEQAYPAGYDGKRYKCSNIADYCGINGKQAWEQCDNGTSNGVIPTANYGETKSYCTSQCQVATVTGPGCYDGKINGAEQCDGMNLSITSCSAFNSSYVSGTLSCKTDCTFNTNNCLEQAPVSCGNGNVDSGEVCDGTNLMGKTCQALEYSLGVNYTEGNLACKADCQGFNTSSCALDLYSIDRITYSTQFLENSNMTFSCIFNIKGPSGNLVSDASKSISNSCILASVNGDFSTCEKVADYFDGASKEYRRTFKCNVGEAAQNKQIQCAVNTGPGGCAAGISPSSAPGLINVTATVADFDFSFRTQTTNTVRASSGELRRFTIDGVTEHTLEITFISSTSVTFVISSDPIEVTLREGESEDVDVDDDGTADLSITLSEIDDGEVVLDFEYILENEEVGECDEGNFRHCGPSNLGTQGCVDGFWSVCNYNTAGSSGQQIPDSNFQNIGSGYDEEEVLSIGTLWIVVIAALIIGILIIVIVMKSKISKIGQPSHRRSGHYQGPRGPPRQGPPPGFPGGGQPQYRG